MKKRFVRAVSVLLCLCLMVLPVSAKEASAESALEKAVSYLTQTVTDPQIGYAGGEWTVLALSRSHHGTNVWFRTYAEHAARTVKENGGELSARRYTEYSRVILAFASLGRDCRNVGGYDLTAKLLDTEKTMTQGLSGAIYGLLALDAAGITEKTAREYYLNELLTRQHTDGSYGLTDTPDVDLTAMALQALSPYREREGVESSIAKALSYLSSVQGEDGSFGSWGTVNTESTAQVLMAFCALGLSENDPRFEKALSALLDDQLSDGSFCHIPGEKSDLIASEQAALALTAVVRAENGEPGLYDMSDVKKGLAGKNPTVSAPLVTLETKIYTDMTAHPQKELVATLSAREVVDGYSDGSFQPGKAMTRAEFAAIVVRTLGLPQQKTTVFTDVKPNDWHAGYIGAAYAYGLVDGMTDTTFCPSQTITHEQAAALVTRAAKLCGLDTDASEGALVSYPGSELLAAWAKPYMAVCVSLQILPEAGFTPKGQTMRLEMAEMLSKLLTLSQLM